MPRVITKYGPGDAVEVLMGKNTETDWRAATVYKVIAFRLYQVQIPGVGYITKREAELRAVPKPKEG